MKLSVVFFGSGPVAARSLELLQAWCNIEVVITKPQPPHHKEIFPVINIAQKYELPLLTASNRYELDKLLEQNKFTSRLGVLVDYGIIISRQAIDTFELGIINSHFSILPEWRGADPITFAILSGQSQTGVSLMLLVEKMDEGSLIAYSEYDLPADITTPDLTEDLIELSDGLLRRALPDYLAGKIAPQPQSVTKREVSYSRKLTKADGDIDWQKPAEQLEREIRAFIDWPKSRTQLGNIEVVITGARAAPSQPPDAQPGDIKLVKETGQIMVTTGSGSLRIDRLKPAGKREMTAEAFLAGYGNRLK